MHLIWGSSTHGGKWRRSYLSNAPCKRGKNGVSKCKPISPPTQIRPQNKNGNSISRHFPGMVQGACNMYAMQCVPVPGLQGVGSEKRCKRGRVTSVPWKRGPAKTCKLPRALAKTQGNNTRPPINSFTSRLFTMGLRFLFKWGQRAMPAHDFFPLSVVEQGS